MSSKNEISKEMRDAAIAILQRGEMLPPDFAYDLFPASKKECELTYGGKAREEDVLADTMATPLQNIRLFGANGRGWHNKLIFGDNLQAMKSLLDMKKAGKLRNADGSAGIRLVYIDPPFATKRELISGNGRAYQDKLAAAEFLGFIRRRLIFIRELLSDNGSVYVHLDWRMSAYVRVLMDEIFGKNSFRNAITWNYGGRGGKAASEQFPRNHDTLLFYSKGESWCYKNLFVEHKVPIKDAKDNDLVKDEEGRWFHHAPRGHYTDASVRQLESEGRIYRTRTGRIRIKYFHRSDEKYVYVKKLVGDVWNDIPDAMHTPPSERIGYPTQKSESLLSRVIQASSNKGDIVADFFCGSGTACAVAEKLGRRWIGADCGKLAIYTAQKRMFNLRQDIGNTGDGLEHKPFALYNAGLYDIKRLREADRDGWRKFALMLFECRDEPHKIGGIQMDGYRKGKSVMVFNHHEQKKAQITEETVQEIHGRMKRKAGDKIFIIAPTGSFGFCQDYLDCGNTRYYAMRIPYSVIHELHRRGFSALLQSQSRAEEALNECVDAVGFDFIHPPLVKYKFDAQKEKKAKPGAFIKITTFKSQAHIREPLPERKNMESFSMLMLDYDYGAKSADSKKGAFELDEVFFADSLKSDGWTARFDEKKIGKSVMAIFADIYGNEARELIPGAAFRASAAKRRKGK